MKIAKQIADELQIGVSQSEAAIRLIDEGNTIPFIARYRKEATRFLDDGQLRALYERLLYLRGLEAKKEQAILAIEAQGKLTGALKASILDAKTLVAVDDLYRPYRPKRRTRASAAKEKGLQPLAECILRQNTKLLPEAEAKKYISEKNGVPDADAALNGACDILAELVSDNAGYRKAIRRQTISRGRIVSLARQKETDSVYQTYYSFEEPIGRIAGHQILALNRGEKEKFLSVRIETDESRILSWLERQVIRNEAARTAPYLKRAVTDGYRRLIAPSIEREIRNALTEQAEDGAIRVFAKNLSQLLMQPPLTGQTVLGWDPAFRTGCKLAVADATGKILDTAVIYPTAPTSPKKQVEAKRVLHRLIRTYGITVFSVGNGTASRESERFIAEFFRGIPEKISYVIVNEAGASVYSASKLAAEEFPQFDVGQRSAASIARRLQDPLAELVKIDPKSIGVGQYQHDMDQKKLGRALDGVVESCVSRVGVDLNTASVPLLSRIAGITPATAKNIVAYREANGRFRNRRELLNVPRLGPKVFEQCAGFLRISGGDEPLDNTSVHPESYPAANALLRLFGIGTWDAAHPPLLPIKDPAKTARALGVGEATLRDIAAELTTPGRDPRGEAPRPVFRSDVLELKDLKEGMILTGTVRNVVDFGVFVDIGVHQDGLVHISQLTDKKFVKHPLEIVGVGDMIKVKVLHADPETRRIALTMKGVE